MCSTSSTFLSAHSTTTPSHNNSNRAGRYPKNSSPAMTVLNSRQVDRLRAVLNQNVEIHGKDNFPTLSIALRDLIVHVRRKIREAGLNLKCVRVNGGVAGYVLCTHDNFSFSDIDLIFRMELESEQDFATIRSVMLQSLLELMPKTTNMDMDCDVLRDVYIRKMIKVVDQDRWSLFSLHNDFGRCVEFKFVDKMRRAFEFSVDSFQISLDQLLDNLDEKGPIIEAESMFGNFQQALFHLNHRLIDTRNPEEIRGGGLLKYCFFLARGYRATPICRQLEKYMCSRFFIDFSDINEQEMKLRGFFDNHFGEYQMKLHYLQILHRVIKESTVCLMFHERRQTLAMVDRLKNEISYDAYCNAQCAEYSTGLTTGYSTPTISSSQASTPGSNNTDASYVPRQTLLYLPPNGQPWIPVV
ncbi:nucleotidyltransferase domain-containing protein [Ditylenchus destructor]|uniref:polynucleotide adenylyltransferase n=1 Tax=Ditylenchus destructor TaxID=166010 RepID=A0AAD4RBB0_9BILA|nr:nucleotidyltransferase domain-containing protein [Ditylenchus destructor]